jgi:acetate kinase
MGFTPMEGLVMASRPGNVDPGLLLWLTRKLPLNEIEDALEHESGLAGLSSSNDMREIITKSKAGDKRSALALDIYVHRLCGLIAQMTASLGGLDTLVFTGGVGEGASCIRSEVCERLTFLGVKSDPQLNHKATPDKGLATRPDQEISTPKSQVKVLVITAREDLEINREVRALFSQEHRELS